MNSSEQKTITQTQLPKVIPSIPKEQPPQGFINTNLPLKLLSLAITLTLFLIVLSDKNITQTFYDIPIAIRLPDEFAIKTPPSVQKVNIQIRGRASALKKLDPKEIGPISITPQAKESYFDIPLSQDMLPLKNNFTVTKFDPPNIDFTIEAVNHRYVQISTNQAITGDLLPGYQLGEIKINPPTIEVRGPKSVISEINRVFIEPIDITGRARSFTTERWILPNRQGVTINGSPKVNVTINIIEKQKERVLLGVPIISLNLSRPHEFIPPTVDLVLLGETQSLNMIDSSKVFVAIDGSKDQNELPHSRLIKITNLDVQNLPQGVAVNMMKLQSTVLRTMPTQQELNQTNEENTTMKEHQND